MNKNNLKEETARSDSLFPLHVYSHLDKKGNYFVSHHWHNEIEIVYVQEGELMLDVDMKHSKLTRGQCVFINSGQLHSTRAISIIYY